MLEILFLVFLVKKFKAIALDKNRTTSWALLAVLAWIGGEITGLVAGMQGRQVTGSSYAYGLMGAGAGAFAVYLVLASLPRLPGANDMPNVFT